jgi:hypothetical protein
MKTLTIVALFCSGLGVAGCGSAPSDSTGSTIDALKGGSSAADGGNHGSAGGSHGQGGQGQGSGHGCKPEDGGTSPCARGDGGEDDDADVDTGDDGDDGGGGGHRPDAGKKH